ncbi:MFS transporter [Novosphingobium sp.]|uniref:MFS transporter n=1 Tax=Novosphingobium sp. TaxID=1874826 RepID=UPI003D0F3C23
MDTAPARPMMPSADWRLGLTLAGQGIFPTMGAVLLVPLVPSIMAEFQAMPNGNLWVIALLAVPGLCIALFSPIAGLLADRYGKRRLLIAALLLYGLAGAAPAVIRGYDGLLLTRAMLGVCEAVIMTLSATLVVDLFAGRARDRWLANISLLASIAGVIFAPLGGAIGAAAGWRTVALVYLLSLAFVPLMLRYTREPARGAAVPAATPAAPFPWRKLAICGPATLFGSTLLYGMVFNEGVAFAQLGVTNPATIGACLAVIGLSTPLGSLVFWKAGRLPTSILLPLGYAIIGAGMIVSASGMPGLFVAGLAGALFGCGLILPTVLRWTLQDVPPQTRGRCSGLFQSMLAAGQFVGGIAVQGLAAGRGVIAAFGQIGMIAVGVAMLTALGFMLARRRDRQQPIDIAHEQFNR